MSNANPVSYIKDGEEERVKKEIEEMLGFEPPRVCGWQMAVMLFTREGKKFVGRDGQETSIYIPDTVGHEDRFRAVTGRIVAMGYGCYRGEKFKDYGPTPKVGDWIQFPRHEGTLFNYRGKAMFYLNDDRVQGTVEDPSYVTRDL